MMPRFIGLGFVIVFLVVTSLVIQWRAPKLPNISLPHDTSVQPNEELEIPVILNTREETVNAGELYLKFDPTEFEVKGVTKTNSFFTLWIDGQPSFSNEKGEISFAGGLPTPGFKGEGQIGTIVIVPRKSGTLKIEWDTKSRFLKNDGVGTSIPLSLAPITFNVK